ncbi:MAG: hypothetical protein ACRDH9_00950 [Actinomycetota bacterium]
MPRRHGSARERSGPPSPRPPAGLAPGWAQAEGYLVRQVVGDRAYRCPGCDHEIRPGTAHLVVMPEGQTDLRRHWHTPCWQTELRRKR